MPSEHPTSHVQQQPDSTQQQIKVCSSCHRPLSLDPNASPYVLHDPDDLTETTNVCGPCRTRLLTRCIESPTTRGQVLFAQVEQELLRRAAALQPAGLEDAPGLLPSSTVNPRDQPHEPPPRCLDQDVDMRPTLAPLDTSSTNSSSFSPAPARLAHSPDTPQRTYPAARPSLTLDASPLQTPIYSHVASSPVAASPWASTSKAPFPHPQATYPDPLTDITRLRVRSQGHRCLYPGASFQGTQKSGRNSYDVNVTIVDVDFSSSHLCGYLRIRGLTDDWPELTTYFDAEIIGSKYGFLTRNWGATEQEDMVHWARFPAFRHVRHELKKPHLTMKDADRGAVFMRWKEKFLVPDHRVQDISGASFAGFYYVCVDFNPQHTASAAVQQPSLPPAPEDALDDDLDDLALPKPEPEPFVRARRESSSRSTRRNGRSSSRGVRTEPSSVATMSGFYFHQNSEPYQQLSLVHVPQHTSTSFEFR